MVGNSSSLIVFHPAHFCNVSCALYRSKSWIPMSPWGKRKLKSFLEMGIVVLHVSSSLFFLSQLQRCILIKSGNFYFELLYLLHICATWYLLYVLRLILKVSCRYQSSLGNNNKRVELFDMGAGSSEPAAEDNIQMASGEISF